MKKLFSNRQVLFAGKDSLLKSIERHKSDAYVRVGAFATEIIWGSTSFLYPNTGYIKEKDFSQYIFIFNMVRNDAISYLKRKKKIPNPPSRPPVYKSIKINNSRIAGTDIDHAYWRIAFLLGIISEETYLVGLEVKNKQVRLASLSTLGVGKQYQIFKDGKPTQKYFVRGANKKLQTLYTLIRNTCYGYMWNLKTLLKQDFIAYKVDAIYYAETNKNRKLVEDYLEKHDLEYKHLVNKKPRTNGVKN